jgi:large subunit ribosomal protein L29
MKMSELRELSIEEVNAKLEELREEAFNLRFNKAMNRLENPGRIKEVRRDIARINTLIVERSNKR